MRSGKKRYVDAHNDGSVSPSRVDEDCPWCAKDSQKHWMLLLVSRSFSVELYDWHFQIPGSSCVYLELGFRDKMKKVKKKN